MSKVNPLIAYNYIQRPYVYEHVPFRIHDMFIAAK